MLPIFQSDVLSSTELWVTKHYGLMNFRTCGGATRLPAKPMLICGSTRVGHRSMKHFLLRLCMETLLTKTGSEPITARYCSLLISAMAPIWLLMPFHQIIRMVLPPIRKVLILFIPSETIWATHYLKLEHNITSTHLLMEMLRVPTCAMHLLLQQE